MFRAAIFCATVMKTPSRIAPTFPIALSPACCWLGSALWNPRVYTHGRLVGGGHAQPLIMVAAPYTNASSCNHHFDQYKDIADAVEERAERHTFAILQ